MMTPKQKKGCDSGIQKVETLYEKLVRTNALFEVLNPGGTMIHQTRLYINGAREVMVELALQYGLNFNDTVNLAGTGGHAQTSYNLFQNGSMIMVRVQGDVVHAFLLGIKHNLEQRMGTE